MSVHHWLPSSYCFRGKHGLVCSTTCLAHTTQPGKPASQSATIQAKPVQARGNNVADESFLGPIHQLQLACQARSAEFAELCLERNVVLGSAVASPAKVTELPAASAANCAALWTVLDQRLPRLAEGQKYACSPCFAMQLQQRQPVVLQLWSCPQLWQHCSQLLHQGLEALLQLHCCCHEQRHQQMRLLLHSWMQSTLCLQLHHCSQMQFDNCI